MFTNTPRSPSAAGALFLVRPGRRGGVVRCTRCARVGEAVYTLRITEAAYYGTCGWQAT